LGNETIRHIKCIDNIKGRNQQQNNKRQRFAEFPCNLILSSQYERVRE